MNMEQSPSKMAEILEVHPDQIITPSEVTDQSVAAPHGTPCSACAAPQDSDDLYCAYCGAVNEEAKIAGTSAERVSDPLLRQIHCESCGADIKTEQIGRSYTCPFCESNYVIEIPEEESFQKQADFIIGFAITKEKAEQIFYNWIQEGKWTTAWDLAGQYQDFSIQGVYLPFWTFSMLANSNWHADIGEDYTVTYTTTNSKGETETRTRTKTEWWELSGKHHQFYNGYLVSGSRGLPQQWADSMKPFHLPALKPFKPAYIAGWLSEVPTITKEEALKRTEQVIRHAEYENTEDFLPGDRQNIQQISTSLSQIDSLLCQMPVYLISYRFKNQLYRVLINGQTGRISGDRPVSKRLIYLLITAAVLLGLISIFIPFPLNLPTIVMAIMSLVSIYFVNKSADVLVEHPDKKEKTS